MIARGGGADADVFSRRAIQGIAAPTAADTAAVHELVSGLFVIDDLGAHAVKGISRPMQMYRAIRSGLRGDERAGNETQTDPADRS